MAVVGKVKAVNQACRASVRKDDIVANEVVESASQEVSKEQAGQQVRLRLDEREMGTSYANAFRTNGTAEEVMLDFGVNLMNQAGGGEAQTPEIVFKVNQRVILNYFSAKRLAITLSQLVRRHEEQFGALEMDVAKRRQNGV